MIIPSLSVLAGPNSSKFMKVLCGICHPAVLYFFGTDNFVFYEKARVGVTSFTVAEASGNDELSMIEVLILMWFDAILFTFLHWYFDKVIPRTGGASLPPHFFLMPSYWKDGEVWATASAGYDSVNASDISFAHVEAVSDECKQQEENKTCVQTKGLRKVYNTNMGPKVAVQNLDLCFYKNHVTCLLGHNGAGTFGGGQTMSKQLINCCCCCCCFYLLYFAYHRTTGALLSKASGPRPLLVLPSPSPFPVQLANPTTL